MRQFVANVALGVIVMSFVVENAGALSLLNHQGLTAIVWLKIGHARAMEEMMARLV